MSDPGPQWRRDEEFRQSVIRKALLLGFECEELPSGDVYPWYQFTWEGYSRGRYRSKYSAADDYLRLMKIPHEVIGDYRG